MIEENGELIYKYSPKILQRKYESMPKKARFQCLIRILICFLCVCGLCYYSSMLIYQFFRGRTVVNIKIETSLNNHKIPGFTICYPELFSMEKIAQKYGELKPVFEKYQDYVENVTESGFANENLTKVIQQLYWNNMTKSVEDMKLTVSELCNLSIPYDMSYDPYPHYPIMIDIDGHHHFKNGTSMDTTVTDSTPFESVVFEQNGKMNKCFTFFSHLNKTWRDYYMDIKEVVIHIHHENRHFPRSHYLKNNIKFSMHSPNTLPQTLQVNNFIELKANNKIEITYSRWKVKLLGSGYQTNCHSYDMDDKIDYKFRSDCINHCIQQQLNECSKAKQRQNRSPYKKCLFPTDALWRKPAFLLYKDLKLCRFWERFVSYDCLYLNMGQIDTICKNKCHPDCKNRYYFYTIKNSNALYDGYMHIKIVHDQYPDQTTEHLPEMPFIQFVSNFGGLLGMWLGLSALAILKFLAEFI